MFRLILTFIFSILLLIVLPFPQVFACGTDTPLYTHFIYMFGHANIIHWIINSWALLVLHNLFHWYRLFIAYALSVAVSFISINSSLFTLHSSLTLGLSVITTFFIGFAAIHFYHTNRLAFYQTLLILIIGLFLPHIAGWLHITMFILGILTFKAEMLIRSIHGFITAN